MSTRPLQHGPLRPFDTRRALLFWALTLAFALLCFFVHLLNDQVQRGAAVREQFRLAALGKQPSAKPPLAARPLRLAEAPRRTGTRAH